MSRSTSEQNIIVTENFALNSCKTKEILKTIFVLGGTPLEKTVIVVPTIEENLRRASRNLKTVRVLQANCLNIKDILLTKSIIITQESLKIIEETYNNA